MMSTGSTLRLFIAIELPEPIIQALAEVQEQLRNRVPQGIVRWTRPTGIHLTLKFLGETPTHRKAAIETGIAKAVSGIEPFTLTAEGAGCFPNTRKPRVVWVGMGGEMDALSTLQKAVEREIAPLGFPTESRPFKPHLTLGRVNRRASREDAAIVGQAVADLRLGEIGRFVVAGISLMRSRLRPDGAIYTQLSYVPLER